MPFLQILLNLPFLLAGFGIKIIFFAKKGYGLTYVKGLCKGAALCLSEKGRKHKVKFRAEHLRAYLRIQWELWRNILYRLLG
jgi:hypothetical protein